MAHYFRITHRNDAQWVSNPLQEIPTRLLAQLELGSVESRAAARALLATSRQQEPLMIFPGDGTMLMHERCFVGDMPATLLRAIRTAS